MKIVVFNNSFIAQSETFIYRQVEALGEHFKVELLGYNLVNTVQFNLSKYSFRTVKRAKSFPERAIKWILRRMLKLEFTYSWVTLFSLPPLLKQSNMVVHAHHGWNGIFLYPMLKKYRIPLVVSFHGKDASALLKTKNYRRKLPRLFGYASHIILCSSHMVQALKLEKYLDKVTIIPYGIDVQEFKPTRDSSKKNQITLLHCGRLVPKKGVPDLIRVFLELAATHENVLLQIAGDGKDRSVCEKLVKDSIFVDRVVFIGAVEQITVKRLMNECDIFILNSRTDQTGDMEGFPNSILEAMACEKPVISTRHAGIPMAIEHGRTGLLVDEYDNDGLKDAIQTLITNSEFRRALGRSAREKVVREFSHERMADSLVKVFKEVVC